MQRGEQVIYFNTEAFRAKIESVGAVFRPYHFERELSVGREVVGPLGVRVELMQTAEALLPGLLNEAQTLQPDYILYDSMCVWGKQIAQLLNRPAICSCALFLIGRKNFSAIPHNLLSPWQALRSIPALLKSTWQYRASAARIKRCYGAPSPPGLDFFSNPGDLTLVYTSRYFQIGGELFDDTFKFVGPSLARRNDHLDFPFDFLAGGPVIYISFGTIANEQLDFYRVCLAAFGGTPYRVVLSLGDKVPREALGALPPNILARPYNPQLDILERAALFITHGGMNSVSESAWFGAPMLVAPQTAEQPIIARRVEQLGAGLILNTRQLGPQSLRAQVEKVLNTPAFRQQSRAIGDSFRAAGGYVKAADEIFKFKESKEI